MSISSSRQWLRDGTDVRLVNYDIYVTHHRDMFYSSQSIIVNLSSTYLLFNTGHTITIIILSIVYQWKFETKKKSFTFYKMASDNKQKNKTKQTIILFRNIQFYMQCKPIKSLAKIKIKVISLSKNYDFKLRLPVRCLRFLFCTQRQ